MATAAELKVLFTGDTSGLEEATKKAGGAMGGLTSASKAVGAGFLAVGAAGVGLGAAALKVGMDWDSAYDTIQQQTGATGAKLDELKSAVKGVLGNTPADFDTAAAAVATFGQRLDIVGDVEALSTQIANLSRMTGIDAATAADTATDIFAKFGVAAADQGPLLDTLYVAAQKSGVGFDVLAGNLSAFAPQLQAAGYSAEDATALIAEMGAAGLDAADVMPGLTKAMTGLAKDGKDVPTGLQEIISSISEAGSAADAQKLAVEAFGKSGIKMGESIRSGALDVGMLVTGLADAGGAINDTATSTDDFGEKMAGLKNKVLVALEPLGAAAMDAMNQLVDAMGPVVDKISAALQEVDWEALSTQVGDVMTQIGDKLAAVDWASVLDTVSGVFKKIGDVITWLAENPAIAMVIGAILGIVAAIAPVAAVVVPVISAIGSAFGVISSIVGAVIPIIGAVVTAIGALTPVGWVVVGVIAAIVAIFALWQAKGEEIKAAVADLAASVSAKWNEIWTAISGAMSAIWDVISSTWSNIWQAIVQFLADIGVAIQTRWDAFLREISDKLTAILGTVTTAWENIKQAISAALDFILAVLAAAWDAYRTLIGAALDAIKGIVIAAWEIIKGVFASVWGVISGVVKAGMDFVRSIVDAGMSAIRSVISLGWAVIQAVFQTVIGFVQGIVKGFMQILHGDISGGMETIRAAFSTAWERMKAIVSGSIQGIVAIASGLLTRVKEAIGNAANALFSIGTDLVEGLKRGFTQAWEGLRGVLQRLAGLLPQWAKDILGIHSPSRVFAEIGQWIALGLAAGITDEQKTVIEAVAGTFQAVSNIIASSLAAIRALTENTVPTAFEPLRAGFAVLVATGRAMADVVAGSPVSEEVGKIIGNTAQAITAAAGLAKTVGDAIASLQDVGSVPAGALETIAATATALIAMANTIMAGAPSLAAGVGGYADVVKSAAEIVNAIGNVDVDWGAVTEFDPTKLQIVSDNVDEMVYWVRRIAGGFELRGMTETGAAENSAIAAGIKAYVDMAKASIDLLAQAGGLTVDWGKATLLERTVIEGVLIPNVTSMVDAVDRLSAFFMGHFRAALPEGATGDTRATFAAGIKSYVDMARASIDLLAQAGGLTVTWAKATSISQTVIDTVLVPNVKAFVDAIANETTGLAAQFMKLAAALPEGGTGDTRSTFSAGIKSYVDMAKSAIELFAQAGGVTVDWGKAAALPTGVLDNVLVPNVRAFMTAVRQLSSAFRQAVPAELVEGQTGETRSTYAAGIKAYVDMAKAAIDLFAQAGGITVDWSKAVSVPQAVIDNVLVPNIRAFFTAIRQLSSAFRQALPAALAEGQTGDTRETYAAGIKAYVDMVKGAIDAFVAASGVTVDWSKVTAVTSDMLKQTRANILVFAGEMQGLSSDLLGRFTADDLTTIASTVKSAVEPLAAIAGAVGSLDKLAAASSKPVRAEVITNVVTQIESILQQMSDATTRLGTGVLDQAAALATAAKPAAEAVSSVLDALTALVESPFKRYLGGGGHRSVTDTMANYATRLREAITLLVNETLQALADVTIPANLDVDAMDPIGALVDKWATALDKIAKLNIRRSKTSAFIQAVQDIAAGLGLSLTSAPTALPFNPSAPLITGGVSGTGTVASGQAPQTVQYIYQQYGDTVIVADDADFPGLISSLAGWGTVTP